jgi:hypothetical protein
MTAGESYSYESCRFVHLSFELSSNKKKTGVTEQLA